MHTQRGPSSAHSTSKTALCCNWEEPEPFLSKDENQRIRGSNVANLPKVTQLQLWMIDLPPSPGKLCTPLALLKQSLGGPLLSASLQPPRRCNATCALRLTSALRVSMQLTLSRPECHAGHTRLHPSPPLPSTIPCLSMEWLLQGHIDGPCGSTRRLGLEDARTCGEGRHL